MSEFERTFAYEDMQVVSLVNLKERDDWTEYIGRENKYYDLPESIFSNPYTTDEYARETAVRLYELWFYKQLYSDEDFFESFTELQGETLACWCVPEACHGDVIGKALRAYSAGRLDSFVEERLASLDAVLFGYQDEKEEARYAVKAGERA